MSFIVALVAVIFGTFILNRVRKWRRELVAGPWIIGKDDLIA